MPATQEQATRIDGAQAYNLALSNLTQPACLPDELKRLRPQGFFDFGNGGYGVVLSSFHRIVYVSSGETEDIRKVGPNFKIENGAPVDAEWKILQGRIPQDAAPYVIGISSLLKSKCSDIRALKNANGNKPKSI